MELIAENANTVAVDNAPQVVNSFQRVLDADEMTLIADSPRPLLFVFAAIRHHIACWQDDLLVLQKKTQKIPKGRPKMTKIVFYDDVQCKKRSPVQYLR